MYRYVLTILAAALFAAGASAERSAIPRLDGLEPRVEFWKRIYTEVTTQGGLIHDSEDLSVVYEVVHLPKGLSARSRERRLDKIKDGYRAILRTLATGQRKGLTAEQKRVLKLWPRNVSNATLRSAARRLRFQLGQADKFREGLIRAGAMRDYIQGVLASRGLPPELIALPHVESSYNPRAYSRVGAAGLWQFTRSTGRRYMRVGHVVDERLDVYKATEAAAKLLESNYRRLHTWPLAITAYNHGPSGMARAVRKVGTRDIVSIVANYRSRTFGFASRNFYSEFLAAEEVDRKRERYFGKLPEAEPIPYDTVVLAHFYKATTLAKALGVEMSLLREHNLALRSPVWTGAKHVPKAFELRLPASPSRAPLETALAEIPLSQRLAAQKADRFYKVRRGDTLSKIAGRFRVRQSELVSINRLRSRHRIRVGQVLRLPVRGTPTAVASRKPARQAPPADGVYTVRRGDSLWKIAQRYGVAEQQLAALNGLYDRNRIAVGQTLRLTAAAADSAATPAGEATAVIATVETPAIEESSATPSDSLSGDFSHALARSTAPSPVQRFARVVAIDQPAIDNGAAESDNDAMAVLPRHTERYAVAPDGTVEVMAEETLGHHAEWLEIRASRIRRLNGLRSSASIEIGRRLHLDFSAVDPATFDMPHRLGVTIVYGHTPSPDFQVRSNPPFSLGIDTGAVYGGPLTAVRLPDETIFQGW